VLSGEDAGFSLTTFLGKEAQLREVFDALATVSLFGGGRRLVVVEDADPFVTQYRTELEDYVAKPAKDGVLVLEGKTWPGNTRLAKAVAAAGLAIECKSPTERQLKTWLGQRAKAEHGVRMDAAAIDALVELVPPELGILSQELAKLALLAGANGVIDVNVVRENVGGWRARTTWDMIDAAADGRAADALAQLDRLIAAGEKPHGLLPQMASTLRRFATALELIDAAAANRQRLPPRNALSQAGVPPFKLNDAERQLRQIGRARAGQITRWLLAADLAIKGHNSADDRARGELERLIVRLSTHGSGLGVQGSGSRASAGAGV
jgi:DNA polymerase-3 subunit delta